MKINNSTKKSLLFIALAMASTTYQTQAAPIEHIGDRYIMHVPEMELTGEEQGGYYRIALGCLLCIQ